MGQKFAAGRIAGIPVVIDPTLLVLIVLYGSSYFRAGPTAFFTIGVFVVLGGLASILLHELAHAWAGRICRVDPTHIELNGLGGLCYFARAPHAARDDIFITLAGPASNLALWALFHGLEQGTQWILYDWLYDEAMRDVSEIPYFVGLTRMSSVFATLAGLNLAMFVFNLLPSFPLDGGKALAAMLSRRMQSAQAMKIVATLGYCVCAYCAYVGVRHSPFMLVIAFSLFMANRTIINVYGRTTWTRWN